MIGRPRQSVGTAASLFGGVEVMRHKDHAFAFEFGQERFGIGAGRDEWTVQAPGRTAKAAGIAGDERRLVANVKLGTIREINHVLASVKLEGLEALEIADEVALGIAEVEQRLTWVIAFVRRAQ